GLDRREAVDLRRGPHARLVPVLGGGGLEARHHPSLLRQATGAGLPRIDRMGQVPAAPAPAARGRVRHLGPLRGRLRTAVGEAVVGLAGRAKVTPAMTQFSVLVEVTL